MTGHANDPGWIVRESQRLYPHDLCARIDWLYEQAHTSTSEADRHAVYQAIQRLRNGMDEDVPGDYGLVPGFA